MSSFEVFLHYERPIAPQAVRSLYTSVGWWPERTEEEIDHVLSNHVAIGAWDGDQLIGFARVISDRHFHAYIEDVIIHPTYQRMGLGKLLLTRLIEALPPIETISLFCHSDLVPFYEEQGFQAFPSQTVMHRQFYSPPLARSSKGVA